MAPLRLGAPSLSVFGRAPVGWYSKGAWRPMVLGRAVARVHLRRRNQPPATTRLLLPRPAPGAPNYLPVTRSANQQSFPGVILGATPGLVVFSITSPGYAGEARGLYRDAGRLLPNCCCGPMPSPPHRPRPPVAPSADGAWRQTPIVSCPAVLGFFSRSVEHRTEPAQVGPAHRLRMDPLPCRCHRHRNAKH